MRAQIAMMLRRQVPAAPFPQERSRIDAQAAEWNGKVERLREFLANRPGRVWPQDRQWLDWYEAQDSYVRGLINGGAA